MNATGDGERHMVGEMDSAVVEMGGMVLAVHRISAGFDSAPLYRGLPDDMCPCEHWCYLARGRLAYRWTDGTCRTVEAGELFHVPAGHLADVLEDAELVEVTNAADYRRKAEHLARAGSRPPPS